MTFLKLLGQIILRGVNVARVLAPHTPGGPERALTQAADTLELFAHAVASVEAFGQLKGLTGPEKAQAAGPLVAQAILDSSLVAGKKVKDEALFRLAAERIAGGVADVLNSIDPKEA